MPTPGEAEAQRELLLFAARRLGVATEPDLGDYFRLPRADSKARLAELVEAGELVPATVAGWDAPAYRPPDLHVPRRIRARALLTPFDSMVWARERTERLFDFRYRIEIYVPQPKRIYGYYVLPFLLGDRLTARVDLKGDRQAGVLRVVGAFAEPGVEEGRVARELADELRLVSGWLGLGGVEVGRKGDLRRRCGGRSLMAQDDYTFGDSELAERRLELLGTTFRDTTRDFLRAQAPTEPKLAVDLGSGPGHTTVLLRDTLHPRLTLAVDFSEAYVAATTKRVADDPTVEVLEADALELPARVTDAEVIFVRMLLTHLRDPLGAVDLWLERLAPGGVLLIEEVESIETEEPALARYLALQREMLEANGNRLEIGPRLDAELGSHPALRSSEVATFQPGAGIAARMFGMNFGTWRDRPRWSRRTTPRSSNAIAKGLGRVATAPEDSAPITWGMRQIVLSRPT